MRTGREGSPRGGAGREVCRDRKIPKKLLAFGTPNSILSPLVFLKWGRSSVGRAPQWHCGGQGFDPPRLHHFTKRPVARPAFFVRGDDGVAAVSENLERGGRRAVADDEKGPAQRRAPGEPMWTVCRGQALAGFFADFLAGLVAEAVAVFLGATALLRVAVSGGGVAAGGVPAGAACSRPSWEVPCGS